MAEMRIQIDHFRRNKNPKKNVYIFKQPHVRTGIAGLDGQKDKLLQTKTPPWKRDAENITFNSLIFQFAQNNLSYLPELAPSSAFSFQFSAFSHKKRADC
jgi:hypothetical protein